MSMWERILGVAARSGASKDARASAGLALLGAPTENPFPQYRAEINRQKMQLSAVAARGNYEEFAKALRRLSDEVNLYNCMVGRLIATPVRSLFPNTSDEYLEVTDLHKRHIRKYLDIRKLCISIREKSGLNATGNRTDKFIMLDQFQNQRSADSLNELGLAMIELDEIWKRLQAYENMVYKVKAK